MPVGPGTVPAGTIPSPARQQRGLLRVGLLLAGVLQVLLLLLLLWAVLLLAVLLQVLQLLQQPEWVVPHHLLQQTGAVSSWLLCPAVAFVLVLLCCVAYLLHSGHVACLQLLPAWGLVVVHSACAAQTAAAGWKLLLLCLLPQLAEAVAIRMLQRQTPVCQHLTGLMGCVNIHPDPFISGASRVA